MCLMGTSCVGVFCNLLAYLRLIFKCNGSVVCVCVCVCACVCVCVRVRVRVRACMHACERVCVCMCSIATKLVICMVRFYAHSFPHCLTLVVFSLSLSLSLCGVLYVCAARGMDALRKQNIVHRDLKPGNILIKRHLKTGKMMVSGSYTCVECHCN